MSERPRRTLRLLPRPRSRTTSRPSPSSQTSTTRVSSSQPSPILPTLPPTEHASPTELDPRVRSLETIEKRQISLPFQPRGCESLPAGEYDDWKVTDERRAKRFGGRFESVVDTTTFPDTVQNTVDESVKPLEVIHTEALLSEIAELRAEQESQREAVERLLTAVSSQTIRMERRLDELRVLREVQREEPGAARVLLGGLANMLAAVVLCLLTWLVARPVEKIWRVVKWYRGGTKEARRVSWRLSGREVLSEDPFLASAAKRLSFSTAADLHD